MRKMEESCFLAQVVPVWLEYHLNFTGPSNVVTHCHENSVSGRPHSIQSICPKYDFFSKKYEYDMIRYVHCIGRLEIGRWVHESKKNGKDQETMQSSTTPDTWIPHGKVTKYNKHHQQEQTVCFKNRASESSTVCLC